MRRVVLVVMVCTLGAWTRPAGWPLYERLCLACHGERGDGRGPAAAFAWPAPRDLTRGDFKWRTVPAGQSATDDDLRATIRLGAPGTSMPGFPSLGPAQLDELVTVVRSFAPPARAGTPITLGPAPPPDPARGASLWPAKGCAACHPRGVGAYDLTAGLRRPREPGDTRRAAALSIATGLGAMPGYAGTLSDAELWALADHVVAIGRPRASHAMPAAQVAADRAAPIATATWPAQGDDAIVFGAPIPPQGPPPASLAPAQASLHARQCGRCHAAQLRAWQPSIHGAAASPGLLAQTEFAMPARQRAGCLGCHAPLAEQARDPALLAEGVACAGCHLRNWVRNGPPDVSPALLALPGYPAARRGLYERADLCLPCHQLPPRDAVAGRPLLDTYREWLAGPYMPRGVQCQHCHFPERAHTVLGIHDRETFRQGIALTAAAHRRGLAITVRASLANVGAGHFLPTTTTPAVWLAVSLIDARGQPIAGATDRLRIGRDVWFDGAWHERADTRIPPGESIHLSRAWRAGRTAEATAARITVEVHPDDYYERFYARELAGQLVPAQRALYQQALTRALANRYLAEQRDVVIAPNALTATAQSNAELPE